MRKPRYNDFHRPPDRRPPDPPQMDSPKFTATLTGPPDDKARLDWLEAHCSVGFRWKGGWVQGPTKLRKAIDEAMKTYPCNSQDTDGN